MANAGSPFSGISLPVSTEHRERARDSARHAALAEDFARRLSARTETLERRSVSDAARAEKVADKARWRTLATAASTATAMADCRGASIQTLSDRSGLSSLGKSPPNDTRLPHAAARSQRSTDPFEAMHQARFVGCDTTGGRVLTDAESVDSSSTAPQDGQHRFANASGDIPAERDGELPGESSRQDARLADAKKVSDDSTDQARLLEKVADDDAGGQVPHRYHEEATESAANGLSEPMLTNRNKPPHACDPDVECEPMHSLGEPVTELAVRLIERLDELVLNELATLDEAHDDIGHWHFTLEHDEQSFGLELTRSASGDVFLRLSVDARWRDDEVAELGRCLADIDPRIVLECPASAP